MKPLIALALAGALLPALVTTVAAVPTEAQKCEAAMEKASGKYAQCRLNAEAKYTKNL